MINKDHIDYPKYAKEFWTIVEEEKQELEGFSFDNSSKEKLKDSEKAIIHKKYASKIKELQDKYSYLFEKD